MPQQTCKVLLVGNCGPDEANLRSMLQKHFTVQIDATMYVEQAIKLMRTHPYTLVLFNRVIFADSTPGIELVRRAKADVHLREIPLMMISNMQQAQEQSIAIGGEPGFGKNDLAEEKTIETLSKFLPRHRQASET